MQADFKEKKIITSFSTNVSVGSFALDNLPVLFEHCRERFAVSFKPATPAFFFKTENDQSKNVAKLIWKVESLLNVEEMSSFCLTNRKSVVWVKPSNFWKVCPIRRSLFTVLLRAGNAYKAEEDNFEQAIFSHEFVIPTRRAVMRFLFGFTKYVGEVPKDSGNINTRGWKSLFYNKSDDEITSMLISEKPKINKTNLVAISI